MSRGACMAGGGIHGIHTPPWIKFLTHACENITFPQLLLRAVTIFQNYETLKAYFKEWELFQENGTTCSTIQLQVWRKTTVADQYLLAGYNDFLCDPTGKKLYKKKAVMFNYRSLKLFILSKASYFL